MVLCLVPNRFPLKGPTHLGMFLNVSLLLECNREISENNECSCISSTLIFPKEPAMGVLMIRECSVEPLHAKGYSEQLHALRKLYAKGCETHSLERVGGRRLKDTSIDKIQGIEFQIFWYENGTSRGQYVRIADIPGTLSGEILRFRQGIPELHGEDHEIVGDEIRPLAGQEVPPGPLDDLPENPEDPTDVLASLPVIEHVDSNRQEVKRVKYKSEIVNLLRCQGGSCPGTPISPHIVQLLGKTPEGHLVFERLLGGEIHKAFDSLHDHKRWILHLIAGVKTLHSLGIIHRNLCLSKLYFRDKRNHKSELVIGGLSGKPGNDDAPEIPSQLILDSDYTEKTDIYDIGEVIRNMIYGELPVTKAVERLVPYPLQGIVEACQHKSPELRPGLNSLQAMVEKIEILGPVDDESQFS